MSFLQLFILALATLRAASSPLPPYEASNAQECQLQDMTLIFGGIPCYAHATSFCSEVLVATQTVTKLLSPTSGINPLDLLTPPRPQITPPPPVINFFDKSENFIGLYHSLNCPTPRELGDRTDIDSACACLVGAGSSTRTVTVTQIALPTGARSGTEKAKSEDKGKEERKKMKKVQQAVAPLRKVVYGVKQKEMRPYGSGVEPVPWGQIA